MKKLSTEKMENVEGGDVCGSLMWWFFHDANDNQMKTFELMVSAGCNQ